MKPVKGQIAVMSPGGGTMRCGVGAQKIPPIEDQTPQDITLLIHFIRSHIQHVPPRWDLL